MTEQTVNAYAVGTQHEERVHEVISNELGGPTYYEFIYDLVFAYSHGQARSLFCAAHKLDFITPLNMALIRKDVGRRPSIADGHDHLHIEADYVLSRGAVPLSMLVPDTIIDDEPPDIWGKTPSYAAAIEGN